MRNDFAENVSELIRNMCRYAPYGCRRKVNRNQRSRHEDSCPFLAVDCFAGIGNEVARCGWRGKRSLLLEHVATAHGNSFVHMGPMITDIEIAGFDRNFVEVTLLSAVGELFWVIVKQDSDNNTRLEVVQYIGPKVQSTQFEYQLELGSLNGEYSLSCISVTKDCSEDINEILASKCCFYIHFDHLKEVFLSGGKRLPGYKLTVRKMSYTHS